MKLGERIQYLRKNAGFSQQEFADILGIGRSTLANYEQCKRDPDYETIELIANKLKVSPAYLLGWLDYVVDEDRDIVEWALKNAPYTELNDEKYVSLKTLLNSIGYDLSVNIDGMYYIVGDEGALNLSKDDIDNLFNQTVEYLEFNIRKKFLKNMQNSFDNDR